MRAFEVAVFGAVALAFAAVLLALIVDVERLDRADCDAPVEPRRRQSAWPPRRNQEPEP